MKVILFSLLILVSSALKANVYNNIICKMYLTNTHIPSSVKKEIIRKISSGKYLPYEGIVEIYSPYMRSEKYYEHIKTPWLVFDWDSSDMHKHIQGEPFNLPNFAFNVENGDFLYLLNADSKKFVKKIKVNWIKTGDVSSTSHPMTGEISYRIEKIPEGLSVDDIAAVENGSIKAILLKKAQTNLKSKPFIEN